MKLKIIINYIVFVVLVIGIAMTLSKLIYLNNNSERFFMYRLYNLPKNSVDVLVIGPSTIQTAWSSYVAWNRYGITALNFSFSNLNLPMIQHVITDVLKRQNPKVIIIDINSLFYSNDNDIPYFFYNIFPYIPMSVNKLCILQKEISYFRLNLKDSICYTFPIFTLKRKINPRAFVFDKRFHFIPFEKDYYFKPSDVSKKGELKTPDFDEKLLKKLIKFLNKLQKPIIFVKVPNPYFFTRRVFDVEPISELNSVNNSCYINTNDHDIIKKMDMFDKDFFDEEHSNFIGAKKFTSYICEILADKYGLQDKRNNPDFSFWNFTAKKYITEVKEKYRVNISL